MDKWVNTYLAIAVTTSCNYNCFYCKPGGESFSIKKETIVFEKLKKVIINAHEIGISNFRITGGEPTTVPYFEELVEFIMAYPNTKIRINTNGYKILEYIKVLKKYKNRLDVIFSVDSLSEYINGVHFEKFLSQRVKIITKSLRDNGVLVRYNIVVTSLNAVEVKMLVLEAIDKLSVNVKLLDLNRYPKYLGYDKKMEGIEAIELWKKQFVPMSSFYSWLGSISSNSEKNWTTGFIESNKGIPMSKFNRGKNWIQVKDSKKGASYSKYCTNCLYYKQDNCQEGVFSLFLSSNLVLHLSGCKNELIHFNLNELNDKQMKKCFKKLLEIIRTIN